MGKPGWRRNTRRQVRLKKKIGKTLKTGHDSRLCISGKQRKKKKKRWGNKLEKVEDAKRREENVEKNWVVVWPLKDNIESGGASRLNKKKKKETKGQE